MKIENEDILKSLYEIKLKSRERHFEARGLDISKVLKAEKEEQASYDRLADKLREEIKKNGETEAKQQELTLLRRKRIIQKKIATLIAGRSEANEPFRPWPPWPCYCLPFQDAPFVAKSANTIIIPPNGTGSASVTWDGDSIAHPKADVPGQAGVVNSVSAFAQCKFAFTPADDGIYCIDPMVQMNGHWLMWTWGSCSGDNLGSGSIKIIIRIKVDQLSANITTFENIILNKSTLNKDDGASGFYYDSLNNNYYWGKLNNWAYLEGGHEAVITVECEATVTMADYGRAWVDMQTSPNFYFKAPSVSWGSRFCGDL